MRCTLFNLSQKYKIKSEGKKQIDSCLFTPKRYRTMKRKVKISNITGEAFLMMD